MNILVRAIITGFGLSVGAALFKHASKKLGLDDKAEEAKVPVPARPDGEVESPSQDPAVA